MTQEERDNLHPRTACWIVVGALLGGTIGLYGERTLATGRSAQVHTAACPVALPLTPDAPERVLAAVRAAIPRPYPEPGHRHYLIRLMGEAGFLLGQGQVYYQIAVSQCGKTVANRSWLVFVAFPDVGASASLSGGHLYVARTSRAWRVWYRYH